MAKHAISEALYEELTEKLDGLMDERDDVAEKKARVTKALGGEIKSLDTDIRRIRRQRKGFDLPQTEIPGTEVGQRRRDPAVLEILRQAAMVRLRELKEQGKRLDKTIHDRKVRETSRGAGTLQWQHTRGSGGAIAEVPGGKYEIINDNSRWNLRWFPVSGTAVMVTSCLHRPDAEKAAEQHLLELAGDAMLKNAGDGALTRKELKGPPTARKKGGRHG